MLKAIVFDWNGTLYNKEKEEFYPEARKVLTKVREKYKTGLLSRGEKDARLALLEQTGVKGLFDSIVIMPNKTDEELKVCLAELHVLPEEALVVDDRPKRGVLAGNTLGCMTCWVRQSEHREEMPKDNETPTYIIDEIKELLSLL